MTTVPNSLAEMSHGQHGCVIFGSPQEQVGFTVPFLALGLKRGERSIFVGDDDSVRRVQDGLRATGVDVDAETRRNRLVLISERSYLDHGRFSPDKMLGFLQDAYDSALADGMTALRATGDVSWEVGPRKDFEDVVHYEALLDLFVTDKRLIGMCQYPRYSCPSEVVAGILTTHRLASVDSDLCVNPHYVPPQLLLEKELVVREQKRAEWMTSQLRRMRQTEEERDKLQAQLFQAQKMEAVGRLACGVAHDFNNLLTVISGYSELVLADPEMPRRCRTSVEEVRKAGERASSLTRQLLAFSRKQVLETRVLDLNAILTDTDRMVRRLIGEDIDVATILARDLWKVKVDPGQVEQVVLNLVVNARDAMPAGGKLTIETANVELDQGYATAHAEVEPGSYVMLAVSDSGCGMDAATQARIFEPFFTTKPKDRGTGLGLATVFGIVKQSGGSIWVYSEPGEGTTFKVYFPRCVEEEEVVLTALRPAISKGEETVLLAEDEPSLRPLITEVLRRNGYKVLEAVNGIDAIKLAAEHRGQIDLVVSDLVMPEMGGVELIQRLAKSQPGMRALFISGYTEGGTVHQGARPAGIAYLQKPFTPRALAEKVREVLEAGRVRGTVGSASA